MEDLGPAASPSPRPPAPGAAAAPPGSPLSSCGTPSRWPRGQLLRARASAICEHGSREYWALRDLQGRAALEADADSMPPSSVGSTPQGAAAASTAPPPPPAALPPVPPPPSASADEDRERLLQQLAAAQEELRDARRHTEEAAEAAASREAALGSKLEEAGRLEAMLRGEVSTLAAALEREEAATDAARAARRAAERARGAAEARVVDERGRNDLLREDNRRLRDELSMALQRATVGDSERQQWVAEISRLRGELEQARAEQRQHEVEATRFHADAQPAVAEPTAPAEPQSPPPASSAAPSAAAATEEDQPPAAADSAPDAAPSGAAAPGPNPAAPCEGARLRAAKRLAERARRLREQERRIAVRQAAAEEQRSAKRRREGSPPRPAPAAPMLVLGLTRHQQQLRERQQLQRQRHATAARARAPKDTGGEEATENPVGDAEEDGEPEEAAAPLICDSPQQHSPASLGPSARTVPSEAMGSPQGNTACEGEREPSQPLASPPPPVRHMHAPLALAAAASSSVLGPLRLIRNVRLVRGRLLPIHRPGRTRRRGLWRGYGSIRALTV
eukprot:TRINITY_DN71426_c0_g1_i1.p1 TRINITY_DN71426_c0_g1~~TRINITY_DN71426_c0_g1_i1.p1  ORF type:complete len:586 (+),score=119.07 TRINITY_DN71426_c0_g1_i1:65-1759(+)